MSKGKGKCSTKRGKVRIKRRGKVKGKCNTKGKEAWKGKGKCSAKRGKVRVNVVRSVER